MTHDSTGRLDEFAHVTLVHADITGLPDADIGGLLGALAALTRDPLIAVIVEFDTARIDMAAAALLGTRATLLCEPSHADRVAAVALATLPSLGVGERGRDASDERLKRLNEEVARIAETLARLTRDDPEAPRGGVRDDARGFRAPPAQRPGGGKAAAVRAIIRARRLRDQHFGEGLFADPAWDMLLDLHAADLEDAQVSVSSLCIAAAVPSTTALRWIQTMHQRGLFERSEDPFDKRRAYISLSVAGRAAATAYFAALGEAALTGI